MLNCMPSSKGCSFTVKLTPCNLIDSSSINIDMCCGKSPLVNKCGLLLVLLILLACVKNGCCYSRHCPCR